MPKHLPTLLREQRSLLPPDIRAKHVDGLQVRLVDFAKTL